MNLEEYTYKIETAYCDEAVVQKKCVYVITAFHVVESFSFVGYDILDNEEGRSSLVFYQGVRRVVPFSEILDVFVKKCQCTIKICSVYSTGLYLSVVIIADTHLSTEFMSQNFE